MTSVHIEGFPPPSYFSPQTPLADIPNMDRFWIQPPMLPRPLRAQAWYPKHNPSFATRLLGGKRSLHKQKACPIVTGMVYFPSFIHIWSFLKCYRRNLTNQTAERKQFQLIKKTDKVGLPRIFCRAIGSREGNIWAVHHFDLYWRVIELCLQAWMISLSYSCVCLEKETEEQEGARDLCFPGVLNWRLQHEQSVILIMLSGHQIMWGMQTWRNLCARRVCVCACANTR